ncbi:hypothetical protein WDU94_006230 [Cyamophila willieti]
MISFLPKFLFLFYVFTFTTSPSPVSCFFPFPPPVKDKSSIRPAQDILEICWGDKKLTISPRVLPTLIEYFRLCTNAVNVFTNPEEPLMLSFLRNKMYAMFPDVNRAFLYGAIGYDQAGAVQNAIATLDKYLADKGIPLGEIKSYRWLTINTTSPRTFRSRVTSVIRDITPSNPCRDLVILDGIDKKSNASVKFIPTPYQDDPVKPKFMAIPFTKQFLYDVARADSVGVLIRYYLQSEKCLATFSEKDVTRFKQNMYNVIVHKFLPVIKADPYRIIPGYAGILEILSDVSESIENSNQTQNSSLGFKLKQAYPPLLKKKNAKAPKSVTRNSRQKGHPCNSQDWIWEDTGCDTETCTDSDENTNYYHYLLIVLSVLCIFNCLFCLSTIGYYFFLHKRSSCQPSYPDVTRIKRDRDCTSPGRKESTVWSRAKQTLCDGRKTRCHRNLETILCHGKRGQAGCHGNRAQAASTRSDCQGNKNQAASTSSCCQGKREQNDTKRCCETTPEFQSYDPSFGLQQVKCPHNLVSPRPPQASQPIPYSCFPGRFGLRPGEISMFKPPPCQPCEGSSPGYETHLFRCNTVKQSEEDTVQSIQGSEEFQRIVKELYEQKRSFLQLTLSPRLKPEWSDSTAMSSRKEKGDKPALGGVATPTKQGSRESSRIQGFEMPNQNIERSNLNTTSTQSNERPRST